mmetsp:Transcript_25177/g.43473  ORF Transcript_25177/g.43473 Transcript_25177/m.43473 type:complete len:163 (-) Transcript_25177:644-1132(-)|eukprot:CAMPEP_0196655814 /NCGR_PEP_ID=MMETSP1086-20130531/8602_1 /TAXON_ID=77921 /ORGANISM="Cyanoptyche  gloeocystis , Strain SAG4.97" /LENGTH=162 /DNA_ID=CAMNT_0041988317 /DNA_START=139 /DNA_END=627 /DNA_ORIENTATION=+
MAVATAHVSDIHKVAGIMKSHLDSRDVIHQGLDKLNKFMLQDYSRGLVVAECGTVEILREAMQKHGRSEDLVEKMLCCLLIMSQAGKEVRALLHDDGIRKVVEDVVKLHPDIVAIQVEGRAIIQNVDSVDITTCPCQRVLRKLGFRPDPSKPRRFQEFEDDG